MLTDPSKIAAAGAVKTSAASANTGAAIISARHRARSDQSEFAQSPVTITFTNATTYYDQRRCANQTYTSGGNIDFNGWQVQISGAPAAATFHRAAAMRGQPAITATP